MRAGVKALHTAAVAELLAGRPPNPVLGRHPPEIAREERSLPRTTRSTLAQLRAGYSTFLRSYMARIGHEVEDACPECGEEDHSTLHIFNCPSRPTTLSVVDLWARPAHGR